MQVQLRHSQNKGFSTQWLPVKIIPFPMVSLLHNSKPSEICKNRCALIGFALENVNPTGREKKI